MRRLEPAFDQDSTGRSVLWMVESSNGRYVSIADVIHFLEGPCGDTITTGKEIAARLKDSIQEN